MTAQPKLPAYRALDELLQRRVDLQHAIEFGRLQMRQLAEATESSSRDLAEIDRRISQTIEGLAS